MVAVEGRARGAARTQDQRPVCPPARRNDMTPWRSSRACCFGRLGSLPGPRGRCGSGGSACAATSLTRGTRCGVFSHVSLDGGVVRMLPPPPVSTLSRPCCGVLGAHTTAAPTCFEYTPESSGAWARKIAMREPAALQRRETGPIPKTAKIRHILGLTISFSNSLEIEL